MAITNNTTLALAPLLYHWPAEKWANFYKMIADETDFDEVYLGEVVCSRRLHLYEKEIFGAAEYLKNAGKKVIISTLALLTSDYEMEYTKTICSQDEYLVEINDVGTIELLNGKEFYVGPFVSIYNEMAMQYMQKCGALKVATPSELPFEEIVKIKEFSNLPIAISVFGRAPLAVSARCYHARRYGKKKMNCEYVCLNDSNGMDVNTLENEDFLSVNGTCTMTNSVINLAAEFEAIKKANINTLRISPHDCDMKAVNRIWRDIINGNINTNEADSRLAAVGLSYPFSNGFFYGGVGRDFITPK